MNFKAGCCPVRFDHVGGNHSMAEPDGVTSSNMNGSRMTTESTPIDTHYTSSGSSPPTIDAAIDWHAEASGSSR